MTTILDIIKDMAVILDDYVESNATINTTYITDANINIDDTKFDNGTLYFMEGANLGVYKVVVWDEANTKWTWTGSVTGESGKDYLVIPPEYPHHILLRSINNALKSFDDVPQEDTSLATVAGQHQYELPQGVYNVKRLEILYNVSDPFDEVESFQWTEQFGKIIFDTGWAPNISNLNLRLTYMVPMAETSILTTTLTPYLHRDLISWTAAVDTLRWRNRKLRGEDIHITDALREAIDNARLMSKRHPIPNVERAPHFSGW